MGNFIDVNNIANANVNDKVILADKVLVKADNGMWVKPLAEQTALVTLETNLDGGASADTNSFKEIEDKLNTITTDVGNRYTKSEIDDKTDLTRLRTHILPENANTDIGSPTKRFRSIHVDEAYLSTNTLYLGDTPVLGTTQDTITIKADVDQSILVKTIGTGISSVQSAKEVNISTDGMNADVKLQANGVNSKVRIGGTGGIELSTPTTAQSDLNVIGNFTLTGNLVHNGQSFVSNATTVVTKDNIIVLNQGELGTGVTAGKAGIQIDRGDESDFQLIFNESTDKFTVGPVGGTHETLATREYVDPIAAGKVDKIIGKGLSTEDYTTVEKTKLSTLENYTLPIATNTIVGGVKVGSGLTINNGLLSVNGGGVADSVEWTGVDNTPTTLNGYGITDAATSGHNHTDASVSVSGFMSASDKVKLNSLSNYTKPASEPISYITGLQTELDAKATTAALNTEKGRIDAILLSASASTDTFAEIVTLINSVDTTNDTAFGGYVTSNNARSTTIETTLGNKVDIVLGKGLSTEDYTTAEKTKLNGIATGANNYILPNASSTVFGGIKVSSTTQTVAANAVTTTASKTYAVQLDASGNALVNVPWTDTDTIYSHPTSGVTAGTYKSVTVNAQGHITAGTNPTTLAGYGITDAATNTHTHTDIYEPVISIGTSVQYLRGDKTWQNMPTSLPASDVSAWAKAAVKPTYTAAEVGALPTSGGALTGALTAIRETKVAMAANAIDLTAGNLFTKTISTATTFTVSGALASGNANSFMLELTNAGAYTITWWAGVKWPGGVAPTLTASGVDILGFYSHDGGVTWRGFVSKDSK